MERSSARGITSDAAVPTGSVHVFSGKKVDVSSGVQQLVGEHYFCLGPSISLERQVEVAAVRVCFLVLVAGEPLMFWCDAADVKCVSRVAAHSGCASRVGKVSVSRF